MATRLPLLKREERRFDEQYFKGVGTGASLGTTIMPGIGTAIAGVGAVVGVISGLFKSKKMKKEARTLTGEQDRMFASAASAKRAELAGRTR
jgi:hypothetical protein